MKIILILAGIYNILWGSWVILDPGKIFEMLSMEAPNYPQIWQCVGMIVAVYGVGYLIAATSPIKYWPIVLVGLLGKVLGPIGFIQAYMAGTFPLSFGWNIVFNDLIWWFPFGAILFRAWNFNRELECRVL